MIRSLLAALLAIALLPVPSLAQGVTRMLLNEQPLNLSVLPFVQNSVLYLPIQVVEHLGLQVHLDPVRRSARLIKPGTFYVIHEGSRQITWQGQGLQISHAPIWQQGTLFVPRSLFVNLGTILTHSLHRNEIRLSAELNRLDHVQVQPGDVYTRLIFQFAREPVYKLSESESAITIELMGIDPQDIDTLAPETKDLLLKGVKIEKTGSGTARIRIEKAYPSPHKLYWLKSPDRLIVDLVKIFQEEKQSSIAPGIQLTGTYQGFGFGPVSHYTVTISPAARIRLEPVLAGQGRGFIKEPVSRLSQRRGALLAINAGYFNAAGVPLGTLMLDRELIASPIYGRTMLGFGANQRLFIAQNDRSLSAWFPAQSRHLAFHGVNLPRQNNQAILYTSRYGLSTGTAENPDAIELQLALDGTVSAISSHNTPIPEEGYVISAQGQGAAWLRANAYEGMRALVYSKVWEQWAQALHLLGGGPQLIHQGQIRITAEQEKFQPDIAQGRAPRTALGLAPDGTIILVVADGRQTRSRGLTLQELAQLLRERGATEAMNFDGGGSSTLVVGGKVINSPSDGKERPVATALLVMRE
ncbi:MAG: hypothetical protein CVV27_00680 [Candidatus Melainabacteria bacterium HGW-Melainabacteria-1]|nr:MAG: hypothetical protein CVV27_00680 [Candidatus Melainabacteria bacterium HGW-Melainabacteria-1]